jgi:hypothetical protein
VPFAPLRSIAGFSLFQAAFLCYHAGASKGGAVMQIEWRNIAPVLVSIGVILLVAVLRNHSRTLAAITATMPINIPLALWIVYSGAPADRAAMTTFVEGLVVGIIPTFAFLLVAWLAVRQGWPLPAIIGGGYVAWGLCLGVVLLIQQALRG